MSYELDFEENLPDENGRNDQQIYQNFEDKSCIHPEVTEFRTYYVKDYYGETKPELLQKCCRCSAYFALDGTEIATSRLIDLR